MFLLALPLFILIHFLSIKHTRRKALKFANFEAIEKVTGSKLVSKNFTLLVIRSLILVSLILASAGTIYWYTGKSNQFDYALVIDASSSMNADDFTPTRLEAAKSTALEFIDSLKGKTRVGITTFTGTTFIKQRLTEDLSKIKKTINSIQIEEIGGTAIGDALVTSSNTIFKEKEGNIMILLTDGQNNMGISPEEAIKYLNDNNVLVYTIGIATEEGGKFIQTPILSKLDETTLKMIASETKGKYFLAQNEKSLKNIYKEIATYKTQRLSKNITVPLLLIALVGLLSEWILINSKYVTLP